MKSEIANKPKLFIHIGVHKTGSTSMQKFMMNNRSFLANESIIVLPKFPNFPNENDQNLRISWEKFEENSILFLNYLSSNNSSKSKKYFLSYEGYSGNYLDRSNAPQIARSLKKITNSFDTKIIIFLRRQDLFLESIYKQIIQEGSSISFRKFIQNYDYESLNWYKLLKVFSNNFGSENIILRIFSKEDLPQSNSLYHEFGEILDSQTLRSVNNVEKQNVSIDINELYFMSIINNYLSPDNVKFVRYILQNKKRRTTKFNNFLLTYKDRLEFFQKFKNENKIICDNFLEGNTYELFAKPQSIEFRNAPKLDLDNFQKLLSFIKEQSDKSKSFLLDLKMKRNKEKYISGRYVSSLINFLMDLKIYKYYKWHRYKI